MRRLVLLLLLACAAFPARAAVISERAEKVTLAMYHVGRPGQRDQGLTQVSESRTVDLPAGPSQIRFRGVAATMVPQTADITGLPGLQEQNFDFNLLSPGSLLQKSVGRTVQLVRSGKGGETKETATVRSGPEGVVLETAAGIQTLGCSGQPERLVFDSMPEELFETPTLSVNVTVPRAGTYHLTLRYLATGLTWTANYVARVNPNGRTLALSGWMTLVNSSESGFGDAPVQVIAGEPRHDEDEDLPPRLETVTRRAGCWQTDIDWSSHIPSEAIRQRLTGLGGYTTDLMGFTQPEYETVNSSASRVAAPSNLGDYKLYALPEPTTMAAKQTKQLQFLDQRQVPLHRIYRVSGGFDESKSEEKAATVMLRTQNSKAGGLGKPLPAGNIFMFGPEGATTVLMGEMQVKDTPVGLPLDIAGNPYSINSDWTMAVSAHSVRLKSEHGAEGNYHYQRDTIEVTATNHKNTPVDFEWCQSASWGDQSRLVTEDRKHEMRDGCIAWPIRLKPGEQVHFRYAFEEDDFNF